MSSPPHDYDEYDNDDDDDEYLDHANEEADGIAYLDDANDYADDDANDDAHDDVNDDATEDADDDADLDNADNDQYDDEDAYEDADDDDDYYDDDGSIVLHKAAPAARSTLSPVLPTEGKLLGRGAFGSVYQHTDLQTNKVVAVKKVDFGPTSGDKVTKEIKALRNEISVMEKLHHERIVQYIRSEMQSTSLCIYMEYMDAGSVKDQLDKNGALGEATTKKYTTQMLIGLDYLHKKSIIHRDVKGSNVLCDGSGNIKLADFGVSKQMLTIQTLKGESDKNTTGIGTAHWMAPEVINGAEYGRKADVWSTGATIVEMLTTSPPWHEFSSIQAMFKIGNLHKAHYVLDPTISGDAEDFLALTFKPEKERPTAEDLMQNAWLKTN